MITNEQYELERKQDAAELKTAMKESKYRDLSERVLVLLWSEFSNIQMANWLITDENGVKRFCEWLESGLDEDAWA